MKNSGPNALRAILVVVLGVLIQAPAIRAALFDTFTWTGNGSSSHWNNTDNWAGGILTPPGGDFSNLGTDDVVFGNSRNPYVLLSGYDFYVHSLTFSGNKASYFLDGNWDGLATLHISDGGITYTPAQPVETVINTRFEFHASQAWNITSGKLVLQDHIYDGDNGYVFTKTGAGTLVFANPDNEFDTSTINLNNGRLVLTASNPINGYHPLGSADLVIGPATGGNSPVLVAANDGNQGSDPQVTLNNSVALNGALTTENQTELHFTGPVTLNLDTTINSSGRPLFLEGSIGESGGARRLTVNGTGAIILTGSNNYTGGTTVTKGLLIFGNVASIPSYNLDSSSVGHLTAEANGYIGFGDSSYTNSVQSYFISDFDKTTTHGTIGLDTDPKNATPNTFTDNITLAGFAADVRIGSATRAILSGTITPQVADYRFGGGGGWLQVDSLLTGAGALDLNSPAALPLTVRLTNSSNAYSAGTSVTNSGLIFAYGLSSLAANSVTINAGGYVGTEQYFELTSELTGFLAHLNPASLGMVGFDSAPLSSPRSMSDSIDLSRFTNALYLGTATLPNGGAGLTLSGTITPAGGASAPYRFAGYKGGALEVASVLTGANGVLIGDPTSPGTFGDFNNRQYSTVALTGDNSALTGNVTLYGGQLLVGQSNGVVGTDPTSALGTGTLVVAGMTLPAGWVDEHGDPLAPILDTTQDGLILPNNISLGTTLQLGSSENYFRLAGGISGTGGLYLEDYAYVSLANDTNSFSGGVYLGRYSELDVDENHATGTGPLSFGNTSNSYVYFDTAAPVIHGLISKQASDYAELYFEQSGAVLTIDQAVNSNFQGEFRSDVYPDDSYRIVKTGPGTLNLASGGMYGYHGTPEATLGGTAVSLQVNQGTLVISDNFYIESSDQTFWVHGGTLALDGGKYLYNPIVVDNNGRLAGEGSFASTVNISSGSIVSPGLSLHNGIGTLHFNELTLGANGVYEWNLNGATPETTGTFDQIVIDNPTTLTFASDSANRFTLKVISLQLNGTPGMVTGFTGDRSYTWDLIVTHSISGTFDPNNFTIDTSLFSSNLPGTFALGFNGTALQLNFQPVPEPATYALLATGLGLVGLTAWRRRRA